MNSAYKLTRGYYTREASRQLSKCLSIGGKIDDRYIQI